MTEVELLKEALNKMERIYIEDDFHRALMLEAINAIQDTRAKLKAAPRYETPEQYKKRTGKKWNSWDAVYARYVWDYPRWRAMSYSEAQEGGYWTRNCRFEITHIVIATEAGCPPFKWVPEETK